MPAKKSPDQLVRETVAQLDPEAARSLLRELLGTLPKPASKPAGASGTKGQLVQQLLRDHPDWNAKQVAAEAGCSPSRVAEVKRAIGWVPLAKMVEPAPVAEEVTA